MNPTMTITARPQINGDEPMPEHANDNAKVRRVEPFHRLYADELLHKSRIVNSQLFFVGQRYAESWETAGRVSIQSPPMVSCGSYDPYRDVPVAARIDKSRPYREAAKVLDAIGLCELVEAIVFHGRPVVEVGKEFSGRSHNQQARSAAITALGIGLLILRNHYDLPANAKMAA